MYSRRSLLRATPGFVGAFATALVGATALGGSARARVRVPGSALKFLFVVNYGGWDPTRVFAPALDSRTVSYEPTAREASAGGVAYVDHPDRPSVRAWFERHAARSVVFNGVLVSSITHESCLRICLTGSTLPEHADWGTLLAAARAEAYPVPHVVIRGPSFPGDRGALVTRTGGNPQLAGLLTGDIADWSDTPVGRPSAAADAVMHAELTRRVQAAAAAARPGREAELTDGLRVALDRAANLQELADSVAWTAATFDEQRALAVDLLARGLARVTTVSFAAAPWDTHFENDRLQSLNFEALFAQLLALQADLEGRPGEHGGTLADETVVVVLSEMGRAPSLNVTNGKDHWPYTSALLTGPNLAGGRVVGGFDERFYGRMVDPASGEATDDGIDLDAAAFGATLLRLADVDPAEHLPGAEPVTAALG